MDYLKEYRSFINSHYLSEGVRKTIGILLPALILGHFNLLQIGMTLSLGALCVSMTDNPGPILHRINGLIVCNAIIFILAIITGFINHIHWLFALLLPLFCFIFSMIGVYGTRATSIGIGALLIIVLQTVHRYEGWSILYNGLYLLAGGSWYFLLCMILHRIRPFKLTQQALGDYMLATADYLRAKATLYEDNFDDNKSKELLLNKQIAAQEKQDLATELIFKTRNIVKESTLTGRILVMGYLDTTDLFQTAMSSHQDYKKLHEHFESSGILSEYRTLILLLATELDEIGIAMQSGKKSIYNNEIDTLILLEREHLQELRLTILEASNVDVFISLKHILDSIDDIANRIRTLHQYTSYDEKLKRKKLQTVDPEDYISHQALEPKLLIDNLSFHSNIFRHSLRIALAALAAYLIGQLFPIGHSYWILLTVIVILKPGYSLTKKRNYERLLGTLLGAALGVLFLYFIKDETAILILLALSMIGAYSFIRINYLVSVALITLYVLLLFHLLDAKDYKSIFADRIIDTIAGSALAFVFSYLLSPIWEHKRINRFIGSIIHDNQEYYTQIASLFIGSAYLKTQTRIARKNSLVSLANLSDAFNQMLSEPKRKQKNIEQIHQLVVANHMLTSHIATLASYADKLDPEFITDDYQPLLILTKYHLARAIAFIEHKEIKSENNLIDPSQTRLLDKRINTLLHIRGEELKQGKIETDTRKILSEFKSIADQFYFIYKISIDIEKISAKMIDADESLSNQ